MRLMNIPVLAVLALMLCAAGLATAQTFPSRPIRFIVPYPPGGPQDPLARGLAPPLSAVLGQPVVVENHPGATGTIGYALCAAAPDAHTICTTTTDFSVLPFLMKLPYDWEKDIAPVTQLLFFRQVLIAGAKTPFNSFREMVAYAKANPGKLNFGSYGEGGNAHQLIEAINRQMGIRVTHIPYKGSGPALQAVIAEEVDMAVSIPPIALTQVKAGKIKVLAINGNTRLSVFPDAGTYGEQGFGLDVRNYMGIVTTAKAPRDQVNRMSREIARIIASPDYNEKYMVSQFYEPVGSTPQEFTAYLKETRKVCEYLANSVKEAGYKAE
jgi:tripartite-type tricarboxylate transporter receptor subunit TctC